MLEARNQYRPSRVTHPGSTLKDLLHERGLSQVDLATRMGRPEKTISEIVNGKATITPETALELELVLGTPASFWLARERNYQEHLARKEQATDLAAHSDWINNFPLNKLEEMGFIPKVKEPTEQVRYVLGFLGVSSPTQWNTIYNECQVAFRRPDMFETDPYALSAWLRAGELKAQSQLTADFNKDGFLDGLKEVRSLTRLTASDFQNQLQDICNQAGVAVSFVPQMPKSPVSGASRWLSPRNALIQLSIRYKTNDHLWFTFFHEAAHILLHAKKAIFLETGNNKDSAEEKEADRWASDFLIQPDDYAQLLESSRLTKAVVRSFADDIGIAPGIVVGRLQHDGHLPYTHLNGLKVKLKWAQKG